MKKWLEDQIVGCQEHIDNRETSDFHAAFWYGKQTGFAATILELEARKETLLILEEENRKLRQTCENALLMFTSEDYLGMDYAIMVQTQLEDICRNTSSQNAPAE